MILRIDYIGDVGSAYIDGKLISDNFYNGTTWEIGLKAFSERLLGKELVLVVTPIEKAADAAKYISTGMAFRPDAVTEHLVEIRSVVAMPEYKIRLET